MYNFVLFDWKINKQQKVSNFMGFIILQILPYLSRLEDYFCASLFFCYYFFYFLNIKYFFMNINIINNFCVKKKYKEKIFYISVKMFFLLIYLIFSTLFFFHSFKQVKKKKIYLFHPNNTSFSSYLYSSYFFFSFFSFPSISLVIKINHCVWLRYIYYLISIKKDKFFNGSGSAFSR